MKSDELNKVEDIYPLTIISMRFGGKIIIINNELDLSTDIVEFIGSLQEDEEVYYDFMKFLELRFGGWKSYGIGDTINEAFDDFKIRLSLIED